MSLGRAICHCPHCHRTYHGSSLVALVESAPLVTCDYVWLFNCSGTLGVGFYGNEEMKKGDNSMYSAASEANDIVSDIHKQVHLYKLICV